MLLNYSSKAFCSCVSSTICITVWEYKCAQQVQGTHTQSYNWKLQSSNQNINSCSWGLFYLFFISSLSAAELIPFFIWQLFTIPTIAHVRVAMWVKLMLFVKCNLMVLFEVIHEFSLSIDSFSLGIIDLEGPMLEEWQTSN